MILNMDFRTSKYKIDRNAALPTGAKNMIEYPEVCPISCMKGGDKTSSAAYSASVNIGRSLLIQI